MKRIICWFVKKNIIYYVKKRREYLKLGCVRAIYDSDKNSRFSMRYSAKWSNKGLHSLLHGIGWTAQIILGKKVVSLPCSLSAYLPTSWCTLLAISLPCSLSSNLAFYQHSMFTYLAPSWCTLLTISILCSLSCYFLVYLASSACYQHIILGSTYLAPSR